MLVVAVAVDSFPAVDKLDFADKCPFDVAGCVRLMPSPSLSRQ